jgi:hypothetical protein
MISSPINIGPQNVALPSDGAANAYLVIVVVRMIVVVGALVCGRGGLF